MGDKIAVTIGQVSETITQQAIMHVVMGGSGHQPIRWAPKHEDTVVTLTIFPFKMLSRSIEWDGQRISRLCQENSVSGTKLHWIEEYIELYWIERNWIKFNWMKLNIVSYWGYVRRIQYQVHNFVGYNIAVNWIKLHWSELSCI